MSTSTWQRVTKIQRGKGETYFFEAPLPFSFRIRSMSADSDSSAGAEAFARDGAVEPPRTLLGMLDRRTKMKRKTI
jgi:hypothetical protein